MRPRGRTISTTTAADIAGVSPDTIRRWAHEGHLPDGVAFRLTARGHMRLLRDEFVRWLDDQMVRPVSWDGEQARLFER